MHLLGFVLKLTMWTVGISFDLFDLICDNVQLWFVHHYENLNTLFDVLQEVLDIARQLLAELVLHNDCEIEENKSKLEQLKTVLEM